MDKRVFLLGDSFTDNLYQYQFFYKKMGISDDVGQIRKYIDCILEDTGNLPLYFDDWLKVWGYDVFNFGLGGCSIYHTFNQFAKIDKNFVKGDKIIVNWTNPERLDWFTDSGRLQILQGRSNDYILRPDAKLAMEEQLVIRMMSMENEDGIGYLKKETIPFMSRLVDLHSKYQPIQWSPFNNISNLLAKDNWFFYEVTHPIFKDYIKEYDSLRIGGETNGNCADGHYSRYGNYYTALIFKTIMEYKSTTSNYIDDNNLLDIVFDVVKKNRPNFDKVDWKSKTKVYKNIL
jgi:hypothetical protein